MCHRACCFCFFCLRVHSTQYIVCAAQLRFMRLTKEPQYTNQNFNQLPRTQQNLLVHTSNFYVHYYC